MLATPFLIGIFVFAFRWIAPRPVWTTAAAIPCIIVAGLFAMNFFEPGVQAFGRSSGPFGFLGSEADFVFFTGLFIVALLVLEKILASFPVPSAVSDSLEIPIRLLLTMIASYVLMAIALTACDTSPRLQSILGLRPDSPALLGVISPDAQWLSLVEFIADGALSRPKRSTPILDTQFDEPLTQEHKLRTFRLRFTRDPT